MAHPVDTKLAERNLTLPPSTAPAANYVPYVITGNVVTISGQLPMKDGAAQFIGKVGKEFTTAEGKQCAELCLLNVLSHLRAACNGDFGKVKRCIRLGIFVNSTPDFTEQPQVANGASDLMVHLFGKAGEHARAAVGVAQLPRGVAVEVEAHFELNA